MTIQKFEDIIAWQKAQDHAVFVYHYFSRQPDFSFKNQICKAVVSISNNIAEGFDRKGDKELSRFLYIALGSASEVKSMIYLAFRLKYLTENERDILLEQCLEVSRLIRGFIKSLNWKDPRLTYDLPTH